MLLPDEPVLEIGQGLKCGAQDYKPSCHGTHQLSQAGPCFRSHSMALLLVRCPVCILSTLRGNTLWSPDEHWIGSQSADSYFTLALGSCIFCAGLNEDMPRCRQRARIARRHHPGQMDAI